MPAPHEILARLEGLNGFITAATSVDTQVAFDWIEDCKRIIKRGAANRSSTNWEFAYLNDIDEDTDVIADGAATLYGLLFDFGDVSTMEDGRFIIRNVTSAFAYDATAALATTDRLSLWIPANAVTAVSEYHAYTFGTGIPFSVGMTAGCEDEDGSSYGAEALGAWFLYTDDS